MVIYRIKQEVEVVAIEVWVFNRLAGLTVELAELTVELAGMRGVPA